MNMERRVSRVTAVREPPGSARRDADIIGAIADRIVPDLFESVRLDPEALFDEVAALTRHTTADFSGVSYDRLAEQLAVRWPAPDAETEGGYRYHEPGSEDTANGGLVGASEAAEGSWSFHTDSGRAQFSNASHRGVPEPVDETYPLTLTTGRRPDVYNTGVRTRTDEDDETSVTAARIHPETVAENLQAFDRGHVVIESRRSAVAVDVIPDADIPPGLVWLPIHNPAANELTLSTADPESAEPNFKQCAVCLRPPEDGHADIAGSSERSKRTESYS